MSSQSKLAWEVVSDFQASRVVAAHVPKADHCGCGWYEFNGRCGHRVKRQPLMCGREREGDVPILCNSALDRDGIPRRIKIEKYRLDRDCSDCRQAHIAGSRQPPRQDPVRQATPGQNPLRQKPHPQQSSNQGPLRQTPPREVRLDKAPLDKAPRQESPGRAPHRRVPHRQQHRPQDSHH
jgi:hypothetical protein